MVVRGIYGEGSEALGNVYQVSNQTTLGKSEEDILADLQSITEQIIQKEREARNALLKHSANTLEDRLYRSSRNFIVCPYYDNGRSSEMLI